MPNNIRPVTQVVSTTQAVVFEVEVESTSEGFTWVIADSGGTIKFTDFVARDPKKNEAQEFSFGQKVSNIGGYQLRLYDGNLGLAANQPLPAKESLAEDSFAVVSTAELPTVSVNPGDFGPLSVRLVADDGGASTVDGDTFPTFDGFVSSLPDRLKPQFYLNYGAGSYQDLLDLAVEYVQDHTFEKYVDLVPKGYLKDRLDDAIHYLPTIGFRGQGIPPNFPDRPLPGYELIWNYWQEEGMLVQTLNVILARFQNRRLPGRDPLARFDVTPLLPLRNRLWTFAEAEVHRLTVRRRAAEYEYEYGLSLLGRAVPRPVSNVERRSGFLESFHQVIHLAHVFYKELDDLTVQADAFPLYRAVRDCHLVLSQGSHNQYGEMALQARAEFYVMQSILAEPQMREFLGGRPMTPYAEDWMDRVDSMKAIQGWTPTSVMHFHDLATLGEQLVLSIRLGNWADPGVDPAQARSWAQAFRAAIQKYAAAYRSVTGVDLARVADATMPSTLIARRTSDGRLGA